MNVKLKSLLMWLMLLVLPMQGFASPTMMPCGPEVPALHAQAGCAPQGAACAAQDGKHRAGPVLAAAPTDHDDHGGAAHHHDGKCGSCSACCSGASITYSPQLSVALDSPAARFIDLDGHAMSSADLAFPERPPRA